jgi:hypothetical protein
MFCCKIVRHFVSVICQSLFFPSPSLFPLRASTFGTDLYIYGYTPIRPYKIEIQITTGDESAASPHDHHFEVFHVV